MFAKLWLDFFFLIVDINSIGQIMRHCLKPGPSQYLVELVAVNVRVTTMCQRMAPSQSDASVSTLLMSIQKWYLTSVPRVAHVRHSGVHIRVGVDSPHMHTRLELFNKHLHTSTPSNLKKILMKQFLRSLAQQKVTNKGKLTTEPDM